jgi:putative flippase GtrA
MRLLVGQGHLPPLPANVLSIAACSVLNFLASDRLVFRGRREGGAPRPPAQLAETTARKTH